jgi:hypothetical protein
MGTNSLPSSANRHTFAPVFARRSTSTCPHSRNWMAEPLETDGLLEFAAVSGGEAFTSYSSKGVKPPFVAFPEQFERARATRE